MDVTMILRMAPAQLSSRGPGCAKGGARLMPRSGRSQVGAAKPSERPLPPHSRSMCSRWSPPESGRSPFRTNGPTPATCSRPNPLPANGPRLGPRPVHHPDFDRDDRADRERHAGNGLASARQHLVLVKDAGGVGWARGPLHRPATTDRGNDFRCPSRWPMAITGDRSRGA